MEAGLRLSRLNGETVVLAGGVAGIAITPRLFLGGGGWVQLEDREIPAEGLRPATDLGFGYGGLVVEVAPLLDTAPLDARLRLLVGAGNADQTHRATGARLAADNFFVVEPGARARWTIGGPLSFGVGLSYRFALAVDDLSDVGSGELSGVSVTFGLRLGPF